MNVSDSNRVRAEDSVGHLMYVCVCAFMCTLCLGTCFGGLCVLFCNQCMWVWEQKSLTDTSVFVCSVLLVLQAGFYITQTVRCCVRQIISNKVLFSMQCLNLD